MDAERAGEFERFEIAPERHALAIFLQSLVVDRFEPEKHVGDAELLPEAEHVLVAQQHVAAGFEIIFFLDPGARHRLAKLEPVALVNEGDVIDDKDARLADRAQILDDPLRADETIGAAVKRPGAAERTIPRTAARKLDRCARVEHAEKIFSPMPQQVARRQQRVERMNKAGRRAFALCRYRARNIGEVAAGSRSRRAIAETRPRPRRAARNRRRPRHVRVSPERRTMRCARRRRRKCPAGAPSPPSRRR